MEFKYGMRLRGFSMGCQPMNGFVRREDSTEKRYHDIIVYNRELTGSEINAYELEPLALPAGDLYDDNRQMGWIATPIKNIQVGMNISHALATHPRTVERIETENGKYTLYADGQAYVKNADGDDMIDLLIFTDNHRYVRFE